MRWFFVFLFSSLVLVSPFSSGSPPTCEYCEHGKGYLYSRHASSYAPYIGGIAVAAAVIVAIIAVSHGPSHSSHSGHH